MKINNPILYRGLCLLFLLLSTVVVLRADIDAPQTGLPTVLLKIGKKEVSAEIASTRQQEMTGLMFRKSMPDNNGMLFLMGKEKQVAFWMKNTYLPLSLAYIGRDGTILEIWNGEPLSEKPIPSHSSKIVFVLEMNQKWFDLNGIKPGDKIIPSASTLEALYQQGLQSGL